MVDTGSADLRAAVRQGIAWSAAGNLVLRFGTVALGILLARLLTPEQFGVFAVALTVQAVLMTLADLGFSAELIRSNDPERRASTVASLGLLTGAVTAGTMVAGSGSIATLLGSPGSADAIAVLSLTLLFAGAGVVPYAMLQREFRQKEIFAIACCDFVVSTAITVGLIWLGWGVMALAVGRVAAQLLTCVLQFVVTGRRPRYGWDRDLVGPVVRFGGPIAAANMFSWVLLSADKLVISRLSGAVELGFYVLAFNISAWPMTALGQVVRAVALPGFSRLDHDSSGTGDPSLARGFGVTWALAVPAGVSLAVLSGPLVVTVYGDRWHPAAVVLAALGIFGSLRLGFDLVVAYLLARGASTVTLWIQVGWLVVLVPALVVGVHVGGIQGAAWAHVLVASVLVAPAYLVAAARTGADVRALLRSTWQPVLAVLPAVLATRFVLREVEGDALSLLLGAACFTGVYLAASVRWLRGLLKDVRGEDPLAHIEDRLVEGSSR